MASSPDKGNEGKCSERWTELHSRLLCQVLLKIQPLRSKGGAHERSKLWEKVANEFSTLFNTSEVSFSKRTIRDRFHSLSKAFERRKSRCFPGGVTDIDKMMSDVKRSGSCRKKELQQILIKNAKKGTVDNILELMKSGEAKSDGGESKNLEKTNLCDPSFENSISELERQLKNEELELRRQEIKLKERKLELMRKELDEKEKGHNILFQEQEERTKKLNDVISMLKQQVDQQQAVLIEVQQQNQILLSLYQKTLEKK